MRCFGHVRLGGELRGDPGHADYNYVWLRNVHPEGLEEVASSPVTAGIGCPPPPPHPWDSEKDKWKWLDGNERLHCELHRQQATISSSLNTSMVHYPLFPMEMSPLCRVCFRWYRRSNTTTITGSKDLNLVCWIYVINCVCKVCRFIKGVFSGTWRSFFIAP